MGRRPKAYIPEQAKLVRSLAAYGVPEEDIATELEMCVETMHKLYKTELKQGRIKADTKLRQKLFQMAIDGNVSCLIFACKTRLGMRETGPVDTSDDVQPTSVQVTVVNGRKRGDDV